MRICDYCMDGVGDGAITSSAWAGATIRVFCSIEHARQGNRDAIQGRGAEALESIATSLEKLANPVRASKPLPPGTIKCSRCPAVLSIDKIYQHYQEQHPGEGVG